MKLLFYNIETACNYFYFIFLFLSNNKRNYKAYLCGKSIIDRPQGSHRLHHANHSDKLIIWRFYYRLVHTIFSKQSVEIVIQNNNNIALYDDAINSEVRLNFIEKMSGFRPGIFINKDKLLQYPISTFNKVFLGTYFFFICVLITPFLFSKRRALFALLLHEIYEQSVVLFICNKYNIKHLFYSCIFHKDSNSSAFLMMKKGIYVTKNPSEDPLYFHNQIIIADELGICNDYQWNEIEEYKDTIFVNKYSKWLPEQYEKLLSQACDTNTSANTIGYYSGGSWLNKYLKFNLTTFKYNPYQAEEELENHLIDYILVNKNVKLIVFLHPLEKNPQHFETTKSYYQSKFKQISYEFADISKNTGEMFNICDTAITVFSGIMTYRFYQGFKGLFYNPYFTDFPIKNSIYDNVSAKNKDELFNLMNESLLLSNQEFKINKLNNKFQLKHD